MSEDMVSIPRGDLKMLVELAHCFVEAHSSGRLPHSNISEDGVLIFCKWYVEIFGYTKRPGSLDNRTLT